MDILRKVKTDKLDAIKLANMALDRWIELREYSPADEIRQTLKICNRQYKIGKALRTIFPVPSQSDRDTEKFRTSYEVRRKKINQCLFFYICKTSQRSYWHIILHCHLFLTIVPNL